MNLLDLAVDFGASKRLTRLIVEDEITRPIRESEHVEKHEKLSYLLNCPYCVSVYTGLGVALCSIVFPRASKFLRYGLAISEIQCSLKDYEEQRAALVADYGPPL